MKFDPVTGAKPLEEFDPVAHAKPLKDFDPVNFAKPLEESEGFSLEGMAREHLGVDMTSIRNAFRSKPSIADQAEASSEIGSDLMSNAVPGVPLREGFVQKQRDELVTNAVPQVGEGAVARGQQAAADDTQFAQNMQIVDEAIRPVDAEGNFLDTLKEGLKSTGRSVEAAGRTVMGDEGGVLQLRREQQAGYKAPELEALMQDIGLRAIDFEAEEGGWLDAAKAVGTSMAWNPTGAAHLVVEQTPNALVPLATGAAGFLAGGLPGGIAGLFGGNVILSAGFRALEGNDKEFTPEQQSYVLKKGLIEGGVITGVDVATLGISNFILGAGRRAVEQATRETLKKAGVQAGDPNSLKMAMQNPELVNEVKLAQTRAFSATQSFAQRAARGGSTVVLESMGEGMGAYLGKLAADGEASKIEAVTEALTSPVSSAITSTALSAFQQRQTAKLSDLTLEQVNAQQTAQSDLQAAEAGMPVGTNDPDPVVVEPIPEMDAIEVANAQRQERILQEGTGTIPEDPEAVEDIVGLDEMMLDPLYKQPLEWETAIAEHMKKDMDAGISAIVARRRALEALPEMTPMTERPISWSSVPEQVGMNLKQAKLAKGSVAVIGGFNDQFSPAYTQALGQTVELWAKRFLGKDEKVIINLSGLKGEAVGGYQQTPSGIHVISPRELVRTSLSERFTGEGVTLDTSGQEGQQGYNTFTQQQTFGALTHEFGHALTMSMFNAAMPEKHIGIVGKLDSGAVVTEKQLLEMPKAEAEVIRDYQRRKEAVLSGRMTAEEMVDTWIGTWKLGKDLMKKQQRDLYSYAKEVLLREAKLLGDARLSSTPLNQITARELIHAMGRQTPSRSTVDSKGNPVTERIKPNAEEIADSNRRAEAYYLQFNEFMAEQFSRFAHAKRIEQGTPLGLYFKRALQALRAFFQALKTRSGQSGEQVLKAGEAFTNWVDQLHVSRATSEAEAKRRRKNARNFKSRMEKALDEVRTPARLVKKIVSVLKQEETKVGEGNPVDDMEFLAQDTEMKEQLKERIRNYLPDLKDPARVELMQLVAHGRLQEAEDQLADIVQERVKNDIGGGYERTPDGQKVSEIVTTLSGKKEASLWQKAVNFTADLGHTLVQLQQLSHESDDMGVRAFVTYQNQMQALKNNLLQRGTEVAKLWENLSRTNQGLLDRVLMDEFYSGQHKTVLMQDPGTGRWEHRAGEEYYNYLRDKNVPVDMAEGQALAELVLEIKNSILQHVGVVEATAVEIIRDKYAKAPLVAKQKEIEMRQVAQKWRDAPFVPQGHYGDFIVKVFENDENGNRRMIYRAHFEDSASQDKAVKALKGKGLDVDYGKVDKETGVQLVLPTEFLSVLADSGEFSSEQLSRVGEAMMPLRGNKAFGKFERDASKIAGASEDRLRNYVNWIEDSANFSAKLRFGRKMTKARAETRHLMEQLKGQGAVEEARTKQRLLDTMSKSQEFMLHPLEEWFQARSVVALTYLMYAPKTALMNLTGLFQTWAAMTSDYGDIKGNAIMARSTKDLMTGNLKFDENWALDQALQDGLIDQGFGYFMSGLANAGNLARRVRPTLLGKAARGFVDLGMFPFKAVETANRKLTFLSVYRAEHEKAIKEGQSPDEAMRGSYETAARYTRLLQNDYASGNRPEIMRGKRSIFMIFLSYPQYMLWLMSGGFERGTRLNAKMAGDVPNSAFGGMTMRMWLIFLAMSGLEGVPFGEAMIDLMQQMWKKFGTGESLRVEGHRFLKETAGIEDRYWRDVVQRGFLHDVLGVDLSGSYSLGKPLPGLGLINPHSQNWREFVGEAFSELAGPFGGVAKAPLALGFDQDVTGRDVANAIPGAAGSIARAFDASQNGVKSSKGERILKDAQGAYRDPTKAEIALMAGGFRLADVARFQNLENLKREQVEYWMGRRTGLKQQYRRAVLDKDPELRKEMEGKILQYNKEIPQPQLRLSGKELNQFVRESRRAIQRLEQDRYSQKVRGLSRDVDRVMR